MIKETVTIASEYVAGLGLDVAKNKIKKKINEEKLRSSLTTFIERQKNYNEMCTLAEEIDFQGLVEYIRNDLISAAGTRIFDPSPKRRGQARMEIVNAAVSFSKANTDKAKYRVSKCISICLDIIRQFYEVNHFSVKDYLLADMIVDAVAEVADETKMSTVQAINEAKDHILAKVTEGGSLFSIDKAVTLAENGNVGGIGTGIRKVLDHISLTHPYAPDFGYDYKNGMIVSKPLTTEAQKLYPPKIVLTGSVKIGGEYFNTPGGNPLNYAYRHQLPITIEVLKATKLLGEKPDPMQDEVQGLVGNTILATPPEFPPAFPCSIIVGDQSFFDYVLLRTQEIEDDGTFVVSNREQGGTFYFEVKIDPKNPSKPDFKISMNNANNHELLNYMRFMSALSKEKLIRIYLLSRGEDFIAGYIKNNIIDYGTGFSSLEEEINFLERVCAIEDYFNVQLSPRGEISNSEYNTVVHISDLITNDQVTGTWSEVTFTGLMSQHFREELTKLDEKQCMFSYVGVCHIDLFGAELVFHFMRTLKCATIVDVDRVRRKAEVLDDGDNIKITFRAGADKTAIDTLKIPEQFNSAS